MSQVRINILACHRMRKEFFFEDLWHVNSQPKVINIVSTSRYNRNLKISSILMKSKTFISHHDNTEKILANL